VKATGEQRPWRSTSKGETRRQGRDERGGQNEQGADDGGDDGYREPQLQSGEIPVETDAHPREVDSQADPDHDRRDRGRGDLGEHQPRGDLGCAAHGADHSELEPPGGDAGGDDVPDAEAGEQQGRHRDRRRDAEDPRPDVLDEGLDTASAREDRAGDAFSQDVAESFLRRVGGLRIGGKIEVELHDERFTGAVPVRDGVEVHEHAAHGVLHVDASNAEEPGGHVEARGAHHADDLEGGFVAFGTEGDGVADAEVAGHQELLGDEDRVTFLEPGDRRLGGAFDPVEPVHREELRRLEADADHVGRGEIAGAEALRFGDAEREVSDGTRRRDFRKARDGGLLGLAEPAGLHHEGVRESDPLAEVVDERESVAPGGHEHRQPDHEGAGGQPEPEAGAAEVAGDQGWRESPESRQQSPEQPGDDDEDRDREQEVADMEGRQAEEGVHVEAEVGVADREQQELAGDQDQAGDAAQQDRGGPHRPSPVGECLEGRGGGGPPGGPGGAEQAGRGGAEERQQQALRRNDQSSGKEIGVPPREDRGDPHAEGGAEQPSTASDREADAGLGARELEAARPDAPKHRELSDLFADGGRHADGDDERAGEERDDGAGAEADPAGADLPVVSGAGPLRGLQPKRSLDVRFVRRHPGRDIETVLEHDGNHARLAGSSGRLLDHAAIDMDPWLLQGAEFRPIANPHDLQIDRGTEAFDPDHVAHADLESPGGQRIEQDLLGVDRKASFEQVVLVEHGVAVGLDAPRLHGESDPSAVLVPSVVGAGEGQRPLHPRRRLDHAGPGADEFGHLGVEGGAVAVHDSGVDGADRSGDPVLDASLHGAHAGRDRGHEGRCHRHRDHQQGGADPTPGQDVSRDVPARSHPFPSSGNRRRPGRPGGRGPGGSASRRRVRGSP